MKRVVKHISVLQSGKILAVMYALLSVVMIPFMLFSFAYDGGKGEPGPGVFILMMVLYPVMGFFGGIIAAAMYNFSVKIVGGVEITEEEVHP